MSSDQEYPIQGVPPASPNTAGGRPPVYVAYPPPPPRPPSRLKSWFLYFVLVSSLLANVSMYSAYKEYFSASEGPSEKYHSGEKLSADRLAIIRVSGMISPPFTGKILKAIDKAREDDKVKGVLLAVNSPGGFVSDSHQIYHKLKRLSEKKPIFVSMGSMAASGGYYIAMGAGEQGKLFAEPTTWTGSIGVIIPHYEISGLAEKIGIKSAPLKTGEFKDTLTPFRELTERERDLWTNIMNQSFDQFLQVIDDGRSNLNLEQIKELATGQIYTAKDAKANGLIDEIGFEDDALKALQNKVGLTKARVVTYEYPKSLAEVLIGSAQADDPLAQWRVLLESTVPRAMYFCSWAPMAAGR